MHNCSKWKNMDKIFFKCTNAICNKKNAERKWQELSTFNIWAFNKTNHLLWPAGWIVNAHRCLMRIWVVQNFKKTQGNTVGDGRHWRQKLMKDILHRELSLKIQLYFADRWQSCKKKKNHWIINKYTNINAHTVCTGMYMNKLIYSYLYVLYIFLYVSWEFA